MNKHDRRNLIKQVYPAACAGDDKAIRLLASLAKGQMSKGFCEICGTVVVGKRCRMHMRNRVAMREKKLLPS